jgi:hypothetical protein
MRFRPSGWIVVAAFDRQDTHRHEAKDHDGRDGDVRPDTCHASGTRKGGDSTMINRSNHAERT